MNGSDAQILRNDELATRARATCALLTASLLFAASTTASERPRTVVVLAGPGETERTDELHQALTAHLIDSGFEPRVTTVDRRPDCPPEPGDNSYEQHLTQGVVSLVWLSDDGDRFCTLTPAIDDAVNQRDLPDSGEGWAARSDVAASMVYSELEPLVRRDDDSDRDQGAEQIRFGLASRVGLDVPTSDLDPFLVAAVEIDFFLPVLERRLVLAIDMSFTKPSHSGRGTDPRIGGEYKYEIDVLQLKAALDIVFRLAGNREFPIPFVGLGPICQYVRTTQTTSIANGENTEWTIEPGF
ncbi:MAG: hypothetical protein JRF63_06865, partial [Deltaproteobacteria bacterium]|nr:hypothetical protein [Deltaproteobacteria bacterium]